jgi:hypothetical protein
MAQKLMREGQLNVTVQWGTASDPDISLAAVSDAADLTMCAIRP